MFPIIYFVMEFFFIFSLNNRLITPEYLRFPFHLLVQCSSRSDVLSYYETLLSSVLEFIGVPQEIWKIEEKRNKRERDT